MTGVLIVRLVGLNVALYGVAYFVDGSRERLAVFAALVGLHLLLSEDPRLALAALTRSTDGPPFSADRAVRSWDMEAFNPHTLSDMWAAFSRLPDGSIVATGFIDDGLVYYEKRPDDWYIVQVDNPNVEDVFLVGEAVHGDGACIDAGGDIEVAHVIRVGGAS